LSLSALTLILIFFFSSCKESNHYGLNIDFDSSSSIYLDLRKYNSLKSDQKWPSDRYYSSDTEGILRSSTSIYDTVNIVIAEVSQGFADSIFIDFPDISDAVSISLTFDSTYNSANKLSGAIVVYEDVDEKLYMRVFESGDGNSNLSMMNTPLKYIDGVSLDNVLFVAINHLELSDIDVMGINGSTFMCDNCSDDISLAELSVNHNLIIDPGFSFRNIVKPCAIGVHMCMDDATGPDCHPFGAGGCAHTPPPICPLGSARKAIDEQNLSNQLSIFDTNMDSLLLYKFRDSLEKLQTGKFYVDFYYGISKHFENSLSGELLEDITESSSSINNFVTAFLSNDSTYVFADSIYNEFVDIAESSSEISNNIMYKTIIDKLIERSSSLRGRSIQEIKTELSD